MKMMILLTACAGIGVAAQEYRHHQLFSKAQAAYLQDIEAFPLTIRLPTADAARAMHRIEGFLGKNAAGFTYVSDFVIQAKLGSAVLTVSRLDLADDETELEMFSRPEGGYRREVAGAGLVKATLLAGGIMRTQIENKERLAVAAIFAGLVQDGIERKEMAEFLAQQKADLHYAVFLSRVSMKFCLTGAFFPAATYEQVLDDNMPLAECPAADRKRYKKVTAFDADRDGDPRAVIDQARIAKALGATHFLREEGKTTHYLFLKPK